MLEKNDRILVVLTLLMQMPRHRYLGHRNILLLRELLNPRDDHLRGLLRRDAKEFPETEKNAVSFICLFYPSIDLKNEVDVQATHWSVSPLVLC